MKARTLISVAIAAFGLLGGAYLAWPYLGHADIAGPLTVLSTLATALASSVAAIAAWQAARLSNETAARASRALGAATAPSLMAWPYDNPDAPTDSVGGIMLWNPSPWDALDLEVTIRRADNSTVVRKHKRLSAYGDDGAGHPTAPLILEWERVLVDGAGEEVVQVCFSDEHKVLRWRSTFRMLLFKGGGVTGTGEEWGSTYLLSG